MQWIQQPVAKVVGRTETGDARRQKRQLGHIVEDPSVVALDVAAAVGDAIAHRQADDAEPTGRVHLHVNVGQDSRVRGARDVFEHRIRVADVDVDVGSQKLTVARLAALLVVAGELECRGKEALQRRTIEPLDIEAELLGELLDALA